MKKSIYTCLIFLELIVFNDSKSVAESQSINGSAKTRLYSSDQLEKQLIRLLFHQYYPFSRPPSNHATRVNETTTSAAPQHNSNSSKSAPQKILTKISIDHLVDLDEKNQILITKAYFCIIWRDRRLAWQQNDDDGGDDKGVVADGDADENEDEDGETQSVNITTTKLGDMSALRRRFSRNIAEIIVPISKIWYPDIYVRNNAADGDSGFLYSDDSRVVVSKNGTVIWKIIVTIKSSCTVNIIYFPFDKQQCMIYLTSWVHDSSLLNLQTFHQDEIIRDVIQNPELMITNASMQSTSSTAGKYSNYSTIKITINITRRPLYYAYTVIAPSILLCMFTVFSFWLPSDKAEKIDMGLTVFLFLYFLQLLISEKTPESNSTPLIGTYLTLVMTINSISLILATIVLQIRTRGDCPDFQYPPPGWLWRGIGLNLGWFMIGMFSPKEWRKTRSLHEQCKLTTKLRMKKQQHQPPTALLSPFLASSSAVPAVCKSNGPLHSGSTNTVTANAMNSNLSSGHTHDEEGPDSCLTPRATWTKYNRRQRELEEEEREKKLLNKRQANIRKQWEQIATSLDRFLFLLFFAITLLLILILFVWLPNCD